MTDAGSAARGGRVSPSMGDVASLAGVALGTVSNALNHPHKVAPRTRERVAAAIAELGFVPNDQARSLAGGRSRSLGLIVTDIKNSFFTDIAAGSQTAAGEADLTLLRANSDNDRARQETYLDLFHRLRFAGVLLAPFEAAPEGLQSLRRHRRPVVLLNVEGDAESCSIVVDNEFGGHEAARHLIAQGRRRVAIVGGPDRLAPLRDRRMGVERAVRESAGAVSLEEIIVDAVNVPQGRRVGAELLDRDPADRPDAVVAATDLLALGIVQSLVGRVAIPRDMSIIGYDNNSAARESDVPISTIAQPGQEMGREGVRLLSDEIEHAAAHRHRALVMKPRLLARGSSTESAITAGAGGSTRER